MEQQQDRSGVGSGSGAGGGGMHQRQDQRVVGSNNSKPQQDQHPPPPAQPQKCPRCDSTNTKFCYYNNYSLSQPRYFCKTCRRYWTQGGTLRNVPVGGGCRKGKRLKRSSSPDNHHHHHVLNTSSTTNTPAPFVSKTILDHQPSSSPLMPIGSGISGMYYPGAGAVAGGGFLSSLAAFQTFNQPINGGGEQFGGSSLSLLPSFNLPFQQMHQLPQQNQHQQHLYLHQAHDLNLGSSSEGLVEEKVSVQQPNRPSSSHQEWSQTFNSPTHDSEATGGGVSVGGYWNSSSTNNNNTNTTNSNANTIGVSLNPTHWTDHLAGYAPPPPSSQQQQAPPPSTSSSSPPSFL